MSIKILSNISQIATLQGVAEKDGRKLLPNDLDIISNGTIVYNMDTILWVGPTEALPDEYKLSPSNSHNIEHIDLTNKVVLPELVDAHTHLIFGGDRSNEYTMRLNGATYEEIAAAGGGILNTMKGTNLLNADQLFKLAEERIERISSYGVGSIEIKSGYGLNFEKEYELSHVIDRLKKHFKNKPRPIQIFNTYMCAHAVPKTFSNSEEYMDTVVIPLLYRLAKENIIDGVDIFHEKNYFNEHDVKKLFTIANDLGISRKSHIDEFADNKGAIIASKYNAISVEHLLNTEEDGIKALANSNTVANLLPGTGFFLGKKQANGRKMLDSGVKVAISSDYNPGSCHFDNVLLIASLAAPQYKMNIAELVASITYNAAHALNYKNQGVIKKGMRPRFSIFNTNSIDRIFYNWGRNFSITVDSYYI